MGESNPRITRTARTAGHRWTLPAISLALLITACAGAREEARPDTPYGLPPAANRFFAAAYDQVATKYVQPVALDDVALNGIGNLRKLDAAFAVAHSGEQIELFYDGNSLGTFNRPRRNDGAEWGQFTSTVVEKGRFYSASLRNAETEAIYHAIVEGVLKNLDQYSRYSGREMAREARASRDGFGGIGITIDTKDGQVRVANVMDETPAQRSGMKADDLIVSIDGEPIAGLETRDVVRRLRGPIGASVAVTVARAGAIAPLSLTLTRALIIPPSVTYRRDGNIAHIKLMSFNQRTTEALHEALRRADAEIGADLSGVVLDLRGNLGGLLDQAISVADTFLPEGQITSTRGRHRSSGQTSYAGRGDLGERVPMVVLVNGASASASEIVAAALQDNGRAVLVGTASFGKGSVQTVIPMPNEGELILTWARFHAPSGYPIADLGVMPTICTSGTDKAEVRLAAVQAGQLTSAATMADWRAADHSDNARLKQLRALCAPETKERESDMEIAKALLSDRGLYARTLQSATQTARAPAH